MTINPTTSQRMYVKLGAHLRRGDDLLRFIQAYSLATASREVASDANQQSVLDVMKSNKIIGSA